MLYAPQQRQKKETHYNLTRQHTKLRRYARTYALELLVYEADLTNLLNNRNPTTETDEVPTDDANHDKQIPRSGGKYDFIPQPHKLTYNSLTHKLGTLGKQRTDANERKRTTHGRRCLDTPQPANAQTF